MRDVCIKISKFFQNILELLVVKGSWRASASPFDAYLLLSSAASGVQGFLSSRQPTYPFNSLSLLIIASTSTLSNFVVYISSARTEKDERAHTAIRATTRCLIVSNKIDALLLIHCSWSSLLRISYKGLGYGSLVARNRPRVSFL